MQVGAPCELGRPLIAPQEAGTVDRSNLSRQATNEVTRRIASGTLSSPASAEFFKALQGQVGNHNLELLGAGLPSSTVGPG